MAPPAATPAQFLLDVVLSAKANPAKVGDAKSTVYRAIKAPRRLDCQIPAS